MKKAVLLAVLLFVFSNMFVSCTTDAYDLPERSEMNNQKIGKEAELILDDNLLIEENSLNYAAKDGDEKDKDKEENNSSTSENTQAESTDPVVSDPKRD